MPGTPPPTEPLSSRIERVEALLPRLREYHDHNTTLTFYDNDRVNPDGDDAADIIEDLLAALAAHEADARERVAVLVAALQPFADCVDQIADDESDEEWAKFRLLIGDYRRARTAIRALPPGDVQGGA